MIKINFQRFKTSDLIDIFGLSLVLAHRITLHCSIKVLVSSKLSFDVKKSPKFLQLQTSYFSKIDFSFLSQNPVYNCYHSGWC